MMVKKIWLKILVLIFCLPLFLLVACSTGWVNWKISPDQKETTFEFKDKKAEEHQYQIREWDILKEAYDQENKIINLDLIQNHYELFELISQTINMKTTKALDYYWKEEDWSYYVDDQNNGFFEKLVTNLQFNFTYQSQTPKNEMIDFNIENEIKEIISGFKNYYDSSKLEWFGKKRYDVEENGISDNGLPNDFIQIADAGQDLIKINLVTSLIEYKSGFALQLSKLVNLPLQSFKYFAKFINQIDGWIESIFNHSLILEWLEKSQIDLWVEEDGFYYPDKAICQRSLFKAKYIYHIISGKIPNSLNYDKMLL